MKFYLKKNVFLKSKKSNNDNLKNYLQNYYKIFDTIEANGEQYQVDIEKKFDDLEFSNKFYKEHVQNNPKFSFLKEKLGVTDFDDYQLVQSFNENDWKSSGVIILHKKRFQELCKDEQKMLKELKQSFEKQKKMFLKNRKAYRHCIDTTLKINYDRLSDTAKKALHFCSFLPSEIIMQSLLYSEDTFNEKIWQELEESSLLLQNNTKSNLDYYTCYQLVQDFAIKSINTKDINNVLLDLVKLIIEKYKNISKEILYKDHEIVNNIFLQFQSVYEHLIKKISNNDTDIQLKLEFIEKIATHSWKYLNQASTAKKFLSSEFMKQLLVSVETQTNASIATSLNNIGLVYKNKGEFDEALMYYQKSLKIRCCVFNVDESKVETQGNADIAQSLNNIGVVYYNKGEFDEALVYYQKALKIRCRVFSVDESQIEIQANASIAQSLNNIGSVYYYKGNYDEALVYYYKSFKIRCRVFDVDETKVETQGNAAIATSLNNIGNVYDSKGEFDKVLVYYHKALKIRCRVFGVDESHLETQGNADIAQSLNNIGLVYNSKGDYDKALMYYYKSLKILFRVFDIDESKIDIQGNVDIAESLYNIANVYYNKSKLDEALVYYHKTLKILCNVFSNNVNHPFIKDTKQFIDICNASI